MVSIADTVAAIKRGELKATDLISDCLQRIKKRSSINAFVEVFADEALKSAEKIDEKVSSGEKVGSLAGIPIAIKDNIAYKDHFLSCASKILEGYRSPYSANVVEKIVAEDGIIIGRANMDEFAMGSSGENSCYGPTLNPLDSSLVPGGSSSGSAAAVAAGMVPVALGSDTGGSIRQPAACCGVVGLKPTYGRVSRWGLVAFASSLDQIGPIARNVEDVSYLLEIISGYDKRDATSADMAPFKYKDVDVRTLRVGYLKEADEMLDGRLRSLWFDSIDYIANIVNAVEKVSVPTIKASIAIYYVVANAEASANLARFDGIRYGYRATSVSSLEDVYFRSRGEGFGKEVKRRIILGTFALASGYYDQYYGRAIRVREKLKSEFMDLFSKVDLLIVPTLASAPHKLGEKLDILDRYRADIFTTPANLVGVPAISVPTPLRIDEKIPWSLQIIGKWWDENGVINLASRIYGKS